MSLAEVQAKMAKTLDEAWARQRAPGLRSGALPATLKVTEALAKSPILAEIAKQLISQGVQAHGGSGGPANHGGRPSPPLRSP
jgi:hypothetical protein